MKNNQFIHYYVEGQNEKKLTDTLKTKMKMIAPGKVTVFNVVEQKITKRKLMELNKGTIVVLVFDTDTDSSEILKENIAFIKKQSFVKDVYCITQVKNLEDELERSSNIKSALEITKTKSMEEHKNKFNQIKDLRAKLKDIGFDIDKFWAMQPSGVFEKIINQAEKVKL